MADLCNEMERFGKGIGSVPRYHIIEALFCGPKTVSEIAKKTKLSQPLVSQHLRTLKEAHLVQDRRQGQEVYYAFNAEHTIRLLKELSTALKPEKPATKRAATR
jgi:DNA-binding transcriptional ArsR family regulator